MDQVTLDDRGRAFGDTVILYAQTWGPRLLAAILILVIGYFVARAVKWAVASVVNRTPLARHAQPAPTTGGKPAARDPNSIGAQLGEAAFWIVMLAVILLAAQPLNLSAATGPLGGMLNDFGRAIPNIIGAVLIFVIGYLIASVARRAVVALMSAARTDRLAAHAGLESAPDPMTLARAVGGVVFALIIIPVTIAALEQLDIRSISEPATAMLRMILDAIPRIIAAAIIVAFAYLIGRFAGNLLSQFLAGTGFDRTMEALGYRAAPAVRPTVVRAADSRGPAAYTSEKGREAGGAALALDLTPSTLVGRAAFVAIVLFGLMEAFRQLGFAFASTMMAEILSLLASVAFGSVIIFVSVVIARIVAGLIAREGETMAATAVRVGIIILGTAIGLRFMGLANDIINLALGLTLGAVAVAFALAFGLGGRDAARRATERALLEAQRDEASTSTEVNLPPSTPLP
jgi:hypothetical protein